MTKPSYCLLICLTHLVITNTTWAQSYVVGGDFDYAPYSFIDKTGMASGLDIDILETLSVDNNIKFTYNLSTWDSVLVHIQTGKIDVITGIIFAEERESVVDFTHPIHTEHYSVFLRKDLNYHNLTNLYNYKLMVLDEDISIKRYLIPMGLYKNYMVAKSLPEALAHIEFGRADYVIAPYSLGLNVIEDNSYQHIKTVGPPIIPSSYCMAVKKGNTQLLGILNKGISELRKNGKLEELNKKWKIYEIDESPYKLTGKYLSIALISLIGLLTLIYIWTRSLRIQIRKKTENLNLKNQELQKSEEKFRHITENSSDIIWHLDKNFIVTYISPADKRIRGFETEEVIGTSLWANLKPEGIEMLRAANEKRMSKIALGEKLPPAIYEMEQICKDGSWVWIEATATAYYDQNNTITGYHGVSRDISERKKIEQALIRNGLQLKDLNATKDKLFSIIAHDLKSPFNAIIGYSSILNEQVKNKDQQSIEIYANIISNSAHQAMTLLSNLMEWALSQTGRTTFKPQDIDINALITENVQFYTGIANQKAITIVDVTSGTMFINADKAMLNTILRNLISNAIKFTPNNGYIHITREVNNNTLEIAIHDTGVGLSQDAIDKLFSLNTLESTPGTQNEKGTGLGLILCKEFIEKHQGQIGVKSEQDKGSTFFFTLPYNVMDTALSLTNQDSNGELSV